MLSTVGEHDGKQPSGFEPLLKQPGDSPFEREGFPRAGSGDDSDAPKAVIRTAIRKPRCIDNLVYVVARIALAR